MFSYYWKRPDPAIKRFLGENSDSALSDSQIYISVFTGELGKAQDLFIEQDLEGKDGRNLASSRLLIRLSIYAKPGKIYLMNSPTTE
jgi:hypothetical protein